MINKTYYPANESMAYLPKPIVCFALGIVFVFVASCSEKPELNPENTSNLINALADSAYNACIFGDSALAAPLTKQLIEQGDKLPTSLPKADAYRTAGMVYNNWLDYNNTFYYYRKAEEILNQIDSPESLQLKAKTWLNMSMVYIMGGDYQHALEFALKGDTIFTYYKMYPYQINAYAKICEIYELLLNEQKAAYYYEKLYNLIPHASDPFSKVTCLLGKSNQLILEKKYQEALQWLDKTEAIADSNGFLETKINILLNRASILKRSGADSHRVLKFLFDAQPFIDELDNPYQKADNYLRIADVYIIMQNNEEANRYLNKAYTLSEQFQLTGLQRNALSQLIDLYAMQKKYTLVYELYLKQDSLTNKYYSEQTTRDLLFLNAKYEAQQRETQIGVLEAQNNLNKIKLTYRNYIIAGILVILTLLLLVLVLIVKWHRQRQQTIKQQQKLQKKRITELEKEKALIALQATLKGEETERGRIAHNLHDGLGGLLTGAKLAMHQMKNNFILSKQMAESFNQAVRLIDDSVKELRQVAHNMMPEILNESGLHSALESFCCALPASGDARIQYNSYGQPIRFNLGFELAVYRIAQELVNNAIKHARAKHINIQLMWDNERLCLTVSDDGIGFDKIKTSNHGQGLLSIQSRINSFGGRFDIQTTTGKGSEFLVEFTNIKTFRYDSGNDN